MRIAVLGAGGLGGYFGGRLAASGVDVTFIARGHHLAALQNDGLRVESVLGDFSLEPTTVTATDDAKTVGPVDFVLFTVKSFDTDTAAASIASLIGPNTVVISLQNGIDNEERIASLLGPEHVAGGVAYIFSGIVRPGFVRHSGGPARLIVGELDGSRTARLGVFVDACLKAGIAAELADDIRVALWTKYGFICAQAGLTASTRRSIGTIRQIPETWDLFREILVEAAAVGRAEGVALPVDLVDRQLGLASTLAPALFSSLYDDLVGGRRVELDALLGELVRRSSLVGIAVPATKAVNAVLLAQAEGSARPDA